MHAFFLREDQDHFHRMCQHWQDTGEAQLLELRVARPEGKLLWVRLAASLSKDQDHATMLRMTLTDITAEKAYLAKLIGIGGYQIFDAKQAAPLRSFQEDLQRIQQAFADQEFLLYYQPKVNMRNGQLVGLEALIRWQHPTKGLLTPVAFLPLIEDHPLSIEVGEWVMNTALSQMVVWRRLGLHLPVSVNLSAYQMQQADFVQQLSGLLARHPDVDPADFELEILETSALQDTAYAAQVIETCRQRGVRFALDDFGTGYSSLTYLKRLKVNTLKIDQGFVRDMLNNPDDLLILKGILGLASAFGHEVIAEGVETIAHGTLLMQIGCDLAQGNVVAAPMPAHEVMNWAEHWHVNRLWHPDV
jgi:EAL domain-containing protein (putative c-di-GMP-specific phosphodiesterase class I)